MHESLDLIRRHYPEANVAGFTAQDGVVAFYSQIRALLRPESRVLDFGAGRGAQISEDPVPYRRYLQDLRECCHDVTGCDLDPVVASNPYLHRADVITMGTPLPYADASFDVIISRSVFEHVADPHGMARELGRVLKPGGVICAMTPNKFGYAAIATRLIPNRLHVRILARVQPDRKAEDVFPTVYRLNSLGDVRRAFGADYEVWQFRVWAEPYYHFNRSLVFRLTKFFHDHGPDFLAPTMCFFIRKRPAA